MFPASFCFNPCKGLRLIGPLPDQLSELFDKGFNPCKGLRLIGPFPGVIRGGVILGFNPCKGLRLIGPSAGKFEDSFYTVSIPVRV